MMIGKRLRSLRENKGMSQGDVENVTGMVRCYISRIENGHSVPSLETLERFAGALEVPLHEMFYSGEGEPPMPNLTQRRTLDELAEEPEKVRGNRLLMLKFKHVLAKLGQPDRDVLLTLAKKLATR